MYCTKHSDLPAYVFCENLSVEQRHFPTGREYNDSLPSPEDAKYTDFQIILFSKCNDNFKKQRELFKF